MKTVFIAEIGNNHNGSMENAFKLVDTVKKAGIYIAKFQFRDMEQLYRDRDVEDLGVEYAKDLLEKYNFSFEQHKEISEYCTSVGVEYMCTPWDVASVDRLEELGVQRYKVASADFDNLILIKRIAETGKPIYLSTGMNTMEEIKKISEFLNDLNVDYTLLHCNSTYPAPFIDIELNFLKTLREIHPNVGYSGHERGVAVSVAAVALGATVLERHVTLDKSMEGPDHHASLLPDELLMLTSMLKEVEAAIENPNVIDRKLSQGALLNKENLGKSIVAAHDLLPGARLERCDIDIMAPGQGVSALHIDDFLGRVTTTPIKKHEFIFPTHFETHSDKLSVDRLSGNWGVPVRPHDVIDFFDVFEAPVFEFHISYKDLQRGYFPEKLDLLKDRKILVHAPELFANSQLLDLCAKEKSVREESISNLQSVCDYCTEVVNLVGLNDKINIITNVGGFSTHAFKELSEKPHLYNLIYQAIAGLRQPNSRIIPQNMAPFPWHFGGQRYQNIFMIPEEIKEFCEAYSSMICLDTAHLSMYCKFAERDFVECFDILLPYTAHIHMSDAKGLNGEGVVMGTGDVDFSYVLKAISEAQTYIVETWQGHKNNGAGFVRELKYLNGLKEVNE